jgi:hypothetical protein
MPSWIEVEPLAQNGRRKSLKPPVMGVRLQRAFRYAAEMHERRTRTQTTSLGNRLPVFVPVVGLLVLFTCVLTGCHDTRSEYFYPSLAAAEKDGAIDRRWLPDFLPESSHAIRVVGDLSPSRDWCAFEFWPSDLDRLLKNAKKVDVLDPSVSRVPDPDKQWWPIVLKGNLDVGKIEKAGFRLYAIETPETSVTTTIWLFAIDMSDGRGFFFSRSKGN